MNDAEKTLDKGWYAVHALSGFEEKARRFLEMRISESGLGDLFGQIIVPKETVAEVVDGKKKQKERRSMPGYIFVEMVMGPETWLLVRDTERITGFVGDPRNARSIRRGDAGGAPKAGSTEWPRPMPKREVDKILKEMEEGVVAPKPVVSYEVGMMVRIVEGPFASFSGTIDEVKPDKQKVRVLVTIFGRATPVDLDFMQVEKN
jgi:transcriptional antiterminator NusG